MSDGLETFQARLGYSFRNPELLRLALTHASYGHERRQPTPDNQRLEFLGDAVLQLAVTSELFHRLPGAPEGQLTPLRARLVNRGQLQVLATELGLGDHLILGRGEENSHGRQRASILADAMEAVIGALYEEAGWDTARAIVQKLLGPALETALAEEDGGRENPKGRLQEKLQAEGELPPVYRCISETGPAHARIYEVVVEWQGKELARGQGPSKKEAEIRAAQYALEARGK